MKTKRWMVLMIAMGLTVSGMLWVNAVPQEPAKDAPKTTAESKPKSNIEDLYKQLRDKDWQVRKAAVEEIAKLDPRDDTMFSLITVFRDDENPDVCKAAQDALAKMSGGKEGKEGGLTKLLFNPKETIPHAIKAIKDKTDDGLGPLYFVMLYNFFNNKDARKDLIKIMETGDLDNRGIVMRCLTVGKCPLELEKSVIKEITPTLVKLLQDKEGAIRVLSSNILGEWGSQEAVPELLKLLKSSDARDVRFAALALGSLDVRESVPELIKILQEKEENQAQPKSGRMIDEIVSWLGSGQGLAIDLLVKFDAKESVPEMLKLLKNKNSFALNNVILALGKMNIHEAAPELIKMLATINKTDKYDSKGILNSLISTLGLLKVKEAGPELEKQQKGDTSFKRGLSTLALIEVGAKDKVTPEGAKDLKGFLESAGSRSYVERMGVDLARIQQALKELEKK